MATHSGILTWKIPWTEEPGRLQSIGLQRVRQSNSSLIYLKIIYMNKEFSGGPVVTKTQGFHCQVGSLVCKLRSCKVHGEAKINKIKHTWTNPSLIITNFIAIFSSWNHISIWLPPYNFILIHFFLLLIILSYFLYYNIYLYILYIDIDLYSQHIIWYLKFFLFSMTKRIWVEKCPLSLIITIILVRPA